MNAPTPRDRITVENENIAALHRLQNAHRLQGERVDQLQRDLTDALAIARELARLSCCMDAQAQGSVGTQVALLEALERRVGVRA